MSNETGQTLIIAIINVRLDYVMHCHITPKMVFWRKAQCLQFAGTNTAHIRACGISFPTQVPFGYIIP